MCTCSIYGRVVDVDLMFQRLIELNDRNENSHYEAYPLIKAIRYAMQPLGDDEDLDMRVLFADYGFNYVTGCPARRKFRE